MSINAVGWGSPCLEQLRLNIKRAPRCQVGHLRALFYLAFCTAQHSRPTHTIHRITASGSKREESRESTDQRRTLNSTHRETASRVRWIPQTQRHQRLIRRHVPCNPNPSTISYAYNLSIYNRLGLPPGERGIFTGRHVLVEPVHHFVALT